MKPCLTSYCLTNFCGRLRCQARLVLSWQDANLSCMQWERPHDMAQCHDYLDIKWWMLKLVPNAMLREPYMLAACWQHLEWFLLGSHQVLLSAAKERRWKVKEEKKGRWCAKEKPQTGVNGKRVLISDFLQYFCKFYAGINTYTAKWRKFAFLLNIILLALCK